MAVFPANKLEDVELILEHTILPAEVTPSDPISLETLAVYEDGMHARILVFNLRTNDTSVSLHIGLVSVHFLLILVIAYSKLGNLAK